MKNRKLLIFLTFLTALLLTMTTYAWFSANNIFEIETFDIQVASRGGLLISTDAKEFKGVVGMLDFLKAENSYPTNVNQMPLNVVPVSSAGEVEKGKLKIFRGEVEQEKDYFLHAKRSLERSGIGSKSEGDFIAFDVFIKSPRNNFLYLDPNSTIKSSTDESTGIENAFRIAFVKHGSLLESASVQSLYNLNNNERFIWELNSNAHNTTAREHAFNHYGLIIKDDRLKYDGIREEIPRNLKIRIKDATEIKYPRYFKRVNPEIISDKNNNRPLELFPISEGINKIRIYIYLEGQDVDCEDGSNYGRLAVNFEFFVR